MPGPAFLLVDWILLQFDSEPDRTARAYRKSIQRERGASIWEDGRTTPFLGSDAFAQELEPLLEQRMRNAEISHSERLATRPSQETLFGHALDKETRDERISLATRLHE